MIRYSMWRFEDRKFLWNTEVVKIDQLFDTETSRNENSLLIFTS